jgi:hypothetical protein
MDVGLIAPDHWAGKIGIRTASDHSENLKKAKKCLAGRVEISRRGQTGRTNEQANEDPEANQEADDAQASSQTEPLACPVCGGRAEFIDPPSFDARSIHCDGCGDYDISGNTWDNGLLNGLSADQRRKVLATARKHNPVGIRPRITSYSID